MAVQGLPAPEPAISFAARGGAIKPDGCNCTDSVKHDDDQTGTTATMTGIPPTIRIDAMAREGDLPIGFRFGFKPLYYIDLAENGSQIEMASDAAVSTGPLMEKVDDDTVGVLVWKTESQAQTMAIKLGGPYVVKPLRKSDFERIVSLHQRSGLKCILILKS